LSACAQLHHIQLSDIDNRKDSTLQPVDVKVSETGVNLHEAVDIQRAVLKDNKTADTAGKIAEMVALFQMGPRTGNPVYSPKYAEGIGRMLYKECPSGRLTGLMSIREARKYPVISGEIVKVTGYCMKPRTPASVMTERDSLKIEDEEQ
jgi:hypothetical protein